MAMNVAADPDRVRADQRDPPADRPIVNDEILPNENLLWALAPGQRFTESDREAARQELREHIKAKVKQAGLWAPHLPEEYGGAGLDFLEHAYMNEVLAYAIGAASLFGVVAPNSGNQSILVKYGTEEQKQKWLIPLDRGQARVGLLDDRARRRRLGPPLAADHRAPRRRRVGDQRPQVVHLERQAGRLLHRHVPHRGPRRAGRRATAG